MPLFVGFLTHPLTVYKNWANHLKGNQVMFEGRAVLMPQQIANQLFVAGVEGGVAVATETHTGGVGNHSVVARVLNEGDAAELVAEGV